MFPLGSVLFPGAVLPLQVFEPRYRRLVADVAVTNNRNGVALIERGSDVGGGDKRSDIATVGEIVRRGESKDGRILLVIVGRERVRVINWLEDDPYPLADVELYPDTERGKGIRSAVERAVTARRRLIALAVEMGAAGQSLDLDVPEDAGEASWTLCGAAPLGSFDRQRLLATDGARRRMELLEQMLHEQLIDLREVLDASGDTE